MPIEVKELVLKATVQNEQGQGSQAAGGGKPSEEMKEELIAECVEKVLRVLKSHKER